MQRIAGRHPSSAPWRDRARSGKTPCECVHTVILPSLNCGERAGRPDRAVRHVGLGVGRLDARLGAVGHAAPASRSMTLSFGRQRHQMLVRCSPDPAGPAPPSTWRFAARTRARLDRLLLALGDDAEEAAVAHHCDHARHRFDAGLVEALELRAVARRPHHAAVHHARQAHVLHVGCAAGDLAGNVEALRSTCRRSCARRRASARPCAVASRLRSACAGELAIGDLAAVRRA